MSSEAKDAVPATTAAEPKKPPPPPPNTAQIAKTPVAAAAATMSVQNIAASMPPPVSARAAAARAYALAPTTTKTTKKPKYKSRPRITTLIPQEVLRNNASLFMSQQQRQAVPAPMPRKRGRPGSKDTQPRKKHAAPSKKPSVPPRKPPSIPIPELSKQDKATLEAAQKRRTRRDSVVNKSQEKVQQAEADLRKAQQRLEAARKAAEKATKAAHDVALKDADDFLLEPNVWNFMYKRLLTFKEKHNGLVNIKRAMTKEDYDWGDNRHVILPEVRKIAKWQQDQRKAKRDGTLLQYQQILLDRLDFNWTPFQGPGPEKWFSNYEKLKDYIKETGTCKVPNNYHDTKLVHWTKGLVTQYRNGKEGKKPALSQERIKLLEDIGFDWGVPRVIIPWETRYQELLLFRAEFGHVNVPWCWKRNKALAAWVNRQRNLYRDLNDGKHSTITTEQIEKLKSVGFQWSTNGKGRYKNDTVATSPPKQEQQQQQQQEDYTFQVV